MNELVFDILVAKVPQSNLGMADQIWQWSPNPNGRLYQNLPGIPDKLFSISNNLTYFQGVKTKNSQGSCRQFAVINPEIYRHINSDEFSGNKAPMVTS